MTEELFDGVRIADETPGSHNDVWLVWDDSDYYGPHLKAVCRSKQVATDWVNANVEERYRKDYFVEGVTFDTAPPLR